jgi:putative hydrolase of the HAD superfamily
MGPQPGFWRAYVDSMNLVFDFGAVVFTWKPRELVAAHFPQRAPDDNTAVAMAHAIFGHPDWHSFDRGALSMDTVVARTAERLSLDPGVLGALMASISDHLAPIAATRDLLAQLHGLRGQQPTLRLYYLSNMPVPYARGLEQRHAFLQWFDGGIFSGDVLHIKPDPAIYQLLQDRFALEPAQTVFIDDLQANVNAAIALGWHGILFESPQQLESRLVAMGICQNRS